MDKRPCGQSGLSLSILGFGGMRMHGDDCDHWSQVVRQAADAGINYFETSHSYCSGTSERKIGLGLRGVRRESVHISTKADCRQFPTSDSIRRAIEDSLRKLQVDYVDFYQLWGLRWDSFMAIARTPSGTLQGIRSAIDDGIVRHVGFTSHDTPDHVIRLLRTGEFECVTLAYNVLDRASELAIAEAGRLRLGVIVMSPLQGGLLGRESSAGHRLFGNGGARSVAEGAFRFVLTNPFVTCAISGMSTSDISDNVRIATDFQPLSHTDYAPSDFALAELRARSGSLCTGCRYCMPCAQGVGIPEILHLFAAATLFDLGESAREAYVYLTQNTQRVSYRDATACKRCKVCTAKCPQGLDIPEELAKAHRVLCA